MKNALVNYDARSFDVIAVNFRGEFETCRVVATWPNRVEFRTEDGGDYHANYEDLKKSGAYYLHQYQPPMPKQFLW